MGGECTSEGIFKVKDQLTLDEEGNCILDLIHLEGSCDDNRSLSVRVVAPKGEENNEDGVLQLYYSKDVGNTFYNKDTPRKALRDVSSDDESRRILHEQARRLLECIPPCSLSCIYDDENDDRGKACCDIHEQTDKCLLNGEGNICKCEDTDNWEPESPFDVFVGEWPECYIQLAEEGESCDIVAQNGIVCRGNLVCKRKEGDLNFKCYQLEEGGRPECSQECQKEVDDDHNLGRDCCEKEGQNEQCSLNGQGNTCSCAADNGRECYIEMRCESDKTWQDDTCKIRPHKHCPSTLLVGCTSCCTEGYSCTNIGTEFICM